MAKVLVSLSGGVDSAATLYKAVQEGHRVHAHHMFIPAYGILSVLQRDAAKEVCKLIGVKYTESEHRGLKEGLESFGMAAFMYSFAGQMNYNQLWMGLDGGNAGFEKEGQRWLDYFELLSNFACKAPDYRLPIIGLSQIEVLAMLPEEISDATWSCACPFIEGNLAYTCMDHTCTGCNCYIQEGLDCYRSRVVDWQSLLTS